MSSGPPALSVLLAGSELFVDHSWAPLAFVTSLCVQTRGRWTGMNGRVARFALSCISIRVPCRIFVKFDV